MKHVTRTLKYLRPYTLYLALSLGCMMGYVVFSTFSLTLIMPFLDTIFETNMSVIKKPVPLPAAMPTAGEKSSTIKRFEHKTELVRASLLARLNAVFLKGSKKEILTRLCIFLFFGFLFKNIFSFGQTFFGALVDQNVVRDLRRDLFRHLEAVSLDFYHKEKAGNLVSRITNDVSFINFMITALMQSFSRDPLLLLMYMGIMFVLSWKLTLFSLLVAPFLGLIMSRVGNTIRKYAIRSHQRIADISAILFESFSGIRIIKAFHAEHHVLKQYLHEVERRRIANMKMIWTSGISSPANEILGATTGVLLLWIGGNEVIQGTTGLTGGGFILFLFAMFSTIQPLKSIGQLWSNVKQGTTAAERIFQILDVKPAVQEAPGARELPCFSREIRFENVWFSYDAGNWVIRNVSGIIPRGSMVALVGPSGSGKSTLADLLLRFYDVQQGCITVDGIDMRHLALESLRHLVSVVTQDTILFHDSVRNNICFGIEGVEQTRLDRAVAAANAADFISELPHGYETMLGDRGVTLSGGQRQRLAIARAVLRDPPILVLDEATSALDTESERLVQDSLERMMKNRTVLVIAHRLSTIQNADEIWVLERGEIIARGPHKTLLESCDLYRRLYTGENELASPPPPPPPESSTPL